METEVWKRKYRNGNTEVRRKAAYRCLVHECALSNGRAGGNGMASTAMAVPVFEGEKNGVAQILTYVWVME